MDGPTGRETEVADRGSRPLEAVPTVSVVVPVGPGVATLERCLGALGACDPRPDEVVVVVDGGGDEAAETARSAGARVECWSEARGPAAARNRGATAAAGDLLVFIDADVLAPGDLVGAVRELFRTEPGLTAAFGSYDDEPASPDVLSQYRNLLHHWVHQQGAEEAFTFWAACGIIRRRAFHEVGGFDESYRRPTIEDIELGYRLRHAGHRIRLLKSLQVKHLKQWRLRNMVTTDLWCRAVPWTRLLLRSRTVTNDLNLNRQGRASVALVGVGVASLGAAVLWPSLLAVAAAAACGLLVANAPLYRFFLRRRGAAFTLAAIPCHWLYYLVGGLGLLLGAAGHLVGELRARVRAAVETVEDRGRA